MLTASRQEINPPTGSKLRFEAGGRKFADVDAGLKVSNMPAVKCCRTIWSWKGDGAGAVNLYELPELINYDGQISIFDTEHK